MSKPFIEKNTSVSPVSSDYTAVSGLRESLIQEYHNQEIHNQECRNQECRNQECHNQECRNQECRNQEIPNREIRNQENFSQEIPNRENSMQIQSMPSGCRRSNAQQSPQTFQAKPCQTSAVCQDTDVAYQAAMPYPLVKPQCKNPRYAAAMLDNMAGQNSEMTAVSFYFYNQLITDQYRELSDTFFHINKVEMHHMSIFGNLAMQLGENPRLWSRRGRGGNYMYWSPDLFKYPQFPLPAPKEPDCSCTEPERCLAVKDLLAQAIEGEKNAITKYMQQTTWIQDINVCDNLRRISADEQLHLDILTRLYHKY